MIKKTNKNHKNKKYYNYQINKGLTNVESYENNQR